MQKFKPLLQNSQASGHSGD